MSLLPSWPVLRAALPPIAFLLAGGCATLLHPGPPVLRVRTGTVVATVHDDRGRVLGTTPLDAALPARRERRLVITAPGHDPVVVTVGRRTRPTLLSMLNPLSWPVDAATGAIWEHAPARVEVALPPAPRDTLTAGVAALTLAEFARAAEAAGCEPLLVDTWRDAALLLEARAGAGPPVPDSVRRIAAEEVDRVRETVRSLCARPGERVARLREVREELARPAPPDPAAALFDPVYFDAGSWLVRDDSVRERLRALGRRLAASPAPVVLVVEGFADADGPEGLDRELGYQRALAVIAEIRRAGLPRECCREMSHGGALERPDVHDAARGETAGHRRGIPGQRDRRVSFSLDYAVP